MTTIAAVSEVQPRALEKDATTFELFGKPVRYSITRRAQKALAQREQPLWVEMELYFSCLVRKQVRTYSQAPTHEQIMEPIEIGNNLNISFRPVVTEHCSISDVEDKPALNTMPVEKPSRMVPKWFKLDHQSGKWLGEFGY